MNITTRFAPSPTGNLHLGTYRTAVFSYLFARHHGGTFVLRIEDTDRARSTKEYEENILTSLEWIGLEYDHVFKQSECVVEHEQQLRELVAKGSARVSKETNDEGIEREVIRFNNPNKTVTFNDLIRGEISFDTTELGDFVIAKSFTEPLFHFVVVADDAAQGVTHVIRGEDHISNTARHILIYEALGKEVPAYAHIPLVLSSDRTKLSKRKGAKGLLEYRDMGFLPEAVLNYVAMVGWNPGTEEELFTKEKLIERFTLDQVQKSGAMFDEVKMRWYNREYLLQMDNDVFKEKVKEFIPETSTKLQSAGRLDGILETMRERIDTFGDLVEMEEKGEFAYFIDQPTYEVGDLLFKKEPSTEAALKHLNHTMSLLEALEVDNWTAERIKSAVWDYADLEGRGAVLWPLRFCLTGAEKSPDPFIVAAILGKDETFARINEALKKLS